MEKSVNLEIQDQDITSEQQLLTGFNEAQKSYIIKQLFPSLQEAIQIFVTDAQRAGHLDEFIQKEGIEINLESQQSSFGGYSFKVRNKSNSFSDEKRSAFTQSKPAGGTFGTFKMDQSKEINLPSGFDPLNSFKEALNEVTQGPKSKNSTNPNTPSQRPSDKYLQTKRCSVFSKTYDSTQEVETFSPPIYQKTNEQLDRLIEVLKKSFLTKNLQILDLKILANAMFHKQYVRNDIIIRYGDMGQEYYVLDKGIVEVIVYKEGTNSEDPQLHKNVQFSKFLSAGVGFGEIALLYNDKRTATIRAAANCDCWVLEGKVFKNIIIKQTLKRRNIQLSFLDNVNLFQHLNKYEKLKLIDGLDCKSLTYGDFVFKEGDQGDNFYIIEEGEVECLKFKYDDQGSQQGFLHVRDLSTGTHFGEIALIKDNKRSLSIRVKSDQCKLLFLDRETFSRILGNIDKYLKKDYDGEFDKKFDSNLPKRQRQGQKITIQGNVATIIEENEADDEETSQNQLKHGFDNQSQDHHQ